MSISVKTVNYIKNNATNSRCFAELCEVLESSSMQLLYHSEVRWLSKGRILTRLYELRHEVREFLESKHHQLASYYFDNIHLAKLAYLADIFEHLNVLNSSMQGTKLTVFQFADKIEAFKRKVGMWSRKVKHGNIQMFHRVSDFLEDLAEVDITSDVSEHLDKLSTKLIHYFPEDPRRGNLWILNPFAVSSDSSEVKLSESLLEELLQLSEDSTMRVTFNMKELIAFGIYAKNEYPCLAKAAIKFLLPFSTTYLCESGFSGVAHIKIKERNRLATGLVCACLRLSFTTIQPQLDEIISRKQPQVPH